MHWLQTLDVDLFRFLNSNLINPLFDWLMPFVSGNAFFYPVLVLTGILLVWRGGTRGRTCVLMLALILPIVDGFLCNTIKNAVGRPRPYQVLVNVHRPGNTDMAYTTQASIQDGPVTGKSMPSSHAANWFAATMVALVYYRRSVRVMLPLAVLVAFSRIYNGVHYPSDVLAGAILGAGCAAASLLMLNAAWVWVGQKWFPLWHKHFPSLLNPIPRTQDDESGEPEPSDHAALDAHWLRVSYILIIATLLFRLIYLAKSGIELTGDEAYQWLWSKHLALSYYSKPPLIAYAQFTGTSIWGDTELGVRFMSPVSAAILSFLLARFMAREINARAAFALMLISTATPLFAVGSVLMTVDPLSVLFWTAAMISGWQAIQLEAGVKPWLWTGLWMGLGFLSKYTELFQLLCWAVFFLLWPQARKHLRRPGPYAALLVNLLCTLPVLIWNWQNHWVTLTHVATDNAKLNEAWKPTLIYFVDFALGEFGLLNPVFFVGMIWVAISFWRRGRHNPLQVYLFSMGAPVFVVYLLWTLHSRVHPNWIAPSVIPLFCLMMSVWDRELRMGVARVRASLIAGISLGLPIVVLLHNTELIGKLTGRYLPIKLDPLHRARGWREVALLVDEARSRLLSEGKPVFIIADHYGLVGEITFYYPQPGAADPANPLVYMRTSTMPENQMYFWPGYLTRKGENAIYVTEVDRDNPKPGPPPDLLLKEFGSVTDLGVHTVHYRGEIHWPLQFFACRGLK